VLAKRTLAVCVCALSAGSGATVALAANNDEAAKGPVIKALTPVVDDQLVPAAQRPTRRLQDRYLRLHAKARKSGEDPGRNIVRRGVKERDGDVRLASARDVKRSVRVLERMTRPAPRAERTAASEKGGSAPGAPGAASGQLEAIAACESGGDPNAVGGGGAYGGKYQFSQETWQSVGGSGNPASAPEAEQDKRAAMLLARDGAGHWPSCGK